MARTLDLYCKACDETEEDILLGMNDPLPTCVVCQGERTISWASGKGPGLKVFRPVFDEASGWISNEDDWNVHRARVAEKQGCKVEDIVAHRQTKSEISTHADEIRHRAAVRRKKQGITADVQKEIKATVQAHGINPLNGKKAKRNQA